MKKLGVDAFLGLGDKCKQVGITVEEFLNKNCEHLRFNKKGKAHCNNYDKRPGVCRDFPQSPADLIEGCGYSFIEE